MAELRLVNMFSRVFPIKLYRALCGSCTLLPFFLPSTVEARSTDAVTQLTLSLVKKKSSKKIIYVTAECHVPLWRLTGIWSRCHNRRRCYVTGHWQQPGIVSKALSDNTVAKGRQAVGASKRQTCDKSGKTRLICHGWHAERDLGSSKGLSAAGVRLFSSSRSQKHYSRSASLSTVCSLLDYVLRDIIKGDVSSWCKKKMQKTRRYFKPVVPILGPFWSWASRKEKKWEWKTYIKLILFYSFWNEKKTAPIYGSTHDVHQGACLGYVIHDL